MRKYFSLKDHVYEHIADQIASGLLNPEEKINENSICQELGISRTPVREALIQLASEGIIDNVPRKGFVVHALDERTAGELYTIIGALDGLAAYCACANLTEKHLNNMAFFAESMDVAIKNGNYEMYNKQQDEFHEIYLQQCGNASLMIILRQQKCKLLNNGYTIETEEKRKEVLFDTNQEHKEMIKIFRAKDAAGIESFMKNVHWDSQKALMDLLRNSL